MPEANFRDLPPIYAWRMLQREQDEQQAAQQADRKLGAVFNRMYPTQQPAQQIPPPGLPPPPGTPMGGPQAPPPGANMAPPQAPAPGANIAPPMGQGGGMPPPPPQTSGPPPGAMPTPAAAQPAPIPPFRPMPGAGPTSPAQGGIAPPPAAPAASEVVSPEVQNFLPKFIDAMRKENIPTEQWQMMLERLPPAIKDQMALQVKQTHEQNQALIGWANAQSRAQTADAATSRADSQNKNVTSLVKTRQVMTDGGDFTPEDYAYWTKVVQKGGSLPPRLATTPGGKKLMAEVMRGVARGDVSPGDMLTNQAEFAGLKSGERALGTRTAGIGLGAAELEKFMPIAIELSNKVDRTSFPTINSILQAGEKGAGGEDVVRFTAAHNAVVTAYSQIVGRGNAVITDKAREFAQEVLSRAYSKGQYSAAADQLMIEAKAAKKAPGTVRQELRDSMTGAFSGDGAGKKRGDAPSAPARQTATNPKTGEKVELVDGKWQPVQ